MEYACVTCGLVDCPCGCDGDPEYCICDVEFRENPGPICEGCGLEGCECQSVGYCVCDKRRNPDPDGKPWGPSLYDPFESRYSSTVKVRSYNS